MAGAGSELKRDGGFHENDDAMRTATRPANRVRRTSRFRLAVILAVLAALLGLPAVPAARDEAALWRALRAGGHVALMRHALAPGTGDPERFALGDCATQRNLSREGRAQAARIGARFRANGIERARVYSSEWCRCMDTAVLLDLGPVTALPALNSFFRTMEREAQQTRVLAGWISDRAPGAVPILVTHQVNITGLTGVFPASGEAVVVRMADNGDLDVLGTIETE